MNIYKVYIDFDNGATECIEVQAYSPDHAENQVIKSLPRFERESVLTFYSTLVD